MSDVDHNRMIPLHIADQAVAACEKEIAALKAENARLRASSFVTAVPVEQYERLLKAGDNMYSWLGVCGRRNSISDDWLRAKKGLPSLAKQWEREKENRARNAAKEDKPTDQDGWKMKGMDF